MNPFLVQVLKQLEASQQRVRIRVKYKHSAYLSTEYGTVYNVSDDSFQLKTHAGMWWGNTYLIENVKHIQSSTKCRSKRDLARYGEYRVFYEDAPVRLDAEGGLDLTNTLKAFLAVA